MSLTLDLLYKVIGVKHEPLVKGFSPGLSAACNSVSMNVD